MLRERPFPLHPQRMHLDSYRRPHLGSQRRNLSVAVAAAALFAIVFGLAARSSTQPLPPAAPANVASTQRSDKLYVEPVPSPPVVQVIRTIPIVPDIVPPPQSLPQSPPPVQRVAAAVEEEEEAKPARVRHRVRGVQKRGDICTRHGLRKVKVGRYRWRCR